MRPLGPLRTRFRVAYGMSFADIDHAEVGELRSLLLALPAGAVGEDEWQQAWDSLNDL